MSEYDTILVELIKKGMSIQRKVMNTSLLSGAIFNWKVAQFSIDKYKNGKIADLREMLELSHEIPQHDC